MNAIEEASTLDLITELKRRHSASFIMLQRDSRNSDTEKDMMWDFHGDELALLGAAGMVRSVITKRLLRAARPIQQD